MNEDFQTLDPNLRRAAIILASVGPDEATAICRRCDPLTAHRLIRAMAILGDVPRDEQIQVVRRLVNRIRGGHTDAGALAVRLKEEVLGLRGGLGRLDSQEAETSFERLALLDRADPNLIWRALNDEMPQAIALIAKHLSPANAAKLLAAMPEETRAEVAFRMASQRPPTTGALRAFARVSDRLIRVAASGGEATEGHIQFVVDVLSQLSRSIAQGIIDAIKNRSEQLGTTIEQMIFSFTDLLRLPGPSLQAILRNTPTSDLALALKGVPEELRMVVFNSLSQRARAVLEEEITLLGPVPAAEAERAQSQIVQVARALEAAGTITLQPGHVEYVE